MKILNIHFKNLNSLEGEWQIDFTKDCYVSDGIFLITGSTGSGKTTILDAICLALYGATPRLGKITKSSNGIMSRQTGECFAEVMFETMQGRFICHFSHHRSKKKPEGKLQQPKHEISDADTGKLIESKLRNVVLVVEKKTGMDFDRFTRSSLLAQGGFAAFLNASPDERAPILEQITGTEIYSRISIQVHKKKTLENEKLEKLELFLSGMQVLDNDHEIDLISQLEQNHKIEKNLVKEHGLINEKIQYQKDLKDKQAQLEHDSALILGKKQELAEIEKIKAKNKLKFDDLKQKRTQGKQLIKKVREKDFYIIEKQKEIKNLLLMIKKDQEKASDMEKNTKSILKSLLSNQKIIQGIDQYFKENQNHSFLVENFTGIEQMFKTLNLNNIKMQNISDRISKAESRKKAIAKEYLKIENKKNLLVKELEEKDRIKKNLDVELAELVTGNDLKALRKTIDGLKHRLVLLDKISYIQKTIQINKDIIKKEQVDFTEKLKQSHALEHDIELEIKTKKLHEDKINHLEKQIRLLDRIRDLEQERLLLKKGNPCPLCGSKDHPYVSEKTPEKLLEETELTKIKIKLNQVLKKLENLTSEKAVKETKAKKISEKINELKVKLDSDKKDQQKIADQLGVDLSQVTDKMVSATQADISKKADLVRKIEVKEDKLKEFTRILEKDRAHHLKSLKDFQKADMARADIDKEITGLLNDHKEIKKEISSDKSILLDKVKMFGINDIEMDQISYILDSLRSKLEIFRKNQADRDMLEKQIISMNSNLDNIKIRQAEIFERIETNMRLQEKSDLKLAALNKERKLLFGEKNPDIEEKILDEELDNFEKIYSKSNLKADKLNHELSLLKLNVKELDKAIVLLKQSLAETKEINLNVKLDILNNELKDLQQSIGSIKHQLNQNQETKKKFKEKLDLIEKQKKECRRWNILHELIGSADGKKFRNFAQGLTFEMMIKHANQKLQTMTDRYLLIRDEINPLELNVLDNYQAGEIRSTKNLSGGEGFIVSLSLALGLSGMVSNNISVDSLFLDEGFGTLDDESLETALESLSSLQQTGKIIGLISHVPALKERISVQIQVEPGMGGRSAIFGPGCTRL